MIIIIVLIFKVKLKDWLEAVPDRLIEESIRGCITSLWINFLLTNLRWLSFLRMQESPLAEDGDSWTPLRYVRN